MQRPNISKRIIIISRPSKRKTQVTFGSNFDLGLDGANHWVALFIRMEPFGMFFYILNVGITNPEP